MSNLRAVTAEVFDRAKRGVRPLTASCAILALTTQLGSADSCKLDAMIVFDGSGSMSEVGFNRLDEPRIFEARKAIRESVPPIAETRELGLVVYGPGNKGECANIDLRFPPMPDAADAVISAVDGLVPGGETPLTSAVKLAAETLEFRTEPGVVVLVTDGKETCNGAPCQLAAELAADSAGLTVHVIGFKVRGEHFTWAAEPNDAYAQGRTVARCLADRTGGEYFSTETTEELVNALRVALGCPTVS